jgi:hypothetical protein
VTYQAAVGALVGLALMLAVIAAYVVLARRYRLLWHPLAILAAVTIVGIVVSVLAELIFRGGLAGVPTMARRSAIGGFGWGLIIGAVVWISRRVFANARHDR